jgi:hypothetical protein
LCIVVLFTIALAVFIEIAFVNAFWIPAPEFGFDLATLRLLGFTISLSPPTWNTYVTFNMSLSNPTFIDASVVSATVDMFYLDGAQQVAHRLNPNSPLPEQYFLATAVSTSTDPIFIAAHQTATVPVFVQAVNSFIGNLQILSLVTRDCGANGSGLWLQFRISGRVQVWRFPTITVPPFVVDALTAAPPCRPYS